MFRNLSNTEIAQSQLFKDPGCRAEGTYVLERKGMGVSKAGEEDKRYKCEHGTVPKRTAQSLETSGISHCFRGTAVFLTALLYL